MSLGANPNGDDVSPINGDSAAPVTQPTFVDPNAQAVNDVVNSEVRADWPSLLFKLIRLEIDWSFHIAEPIEAISRIGQGKYSTPYAQINTNYFI